MIRLEEPVLVWTELFQFGFEELAFLPGDRLLIQDQNVRDIVVVNLFSVSFKHLHNSSEMNAPSPSSLSTLETVPS